MVGILLVLQVSKWNQKRINKEKEKLLLKELNVEFVQNRKQLEEVLQHHHIAMKSTRYVTDKFPIKADEIDLDTFVTKMGNWAFRLYFQSFSRSDKIFGYFIIV